MRSQLLCVFLAALTTAVAVASDYEVPGSLALRDAAPALLIEGTKAEIGDPVDNDGMLNRFVLTSAMGTFEATTTHGLCKLAREVNALDQLAQLRNTEAFSDAATEAATGLVEGAGKLITRPISTVGAAAKGVGKMFRRLGERISRGDESSEVEDGGLKAAIGFSKVKRRLAYEFGVDVYSDNEVLQEYLDRLAWTEFSGSFAFNIVATAATGGLAGAAISFTNYTTAFEEMVRDLGPADLRAKARDLLLEDGIDEDLVNLFIRNGKLSPRQQLFIAGALRSMEEVGGKDLLVREAAYAESYGAGFDLQILAETYARIHREEPFATFVVAGRGPVAKTVRGGLVAAGVVDHLIWTEELAALFRAARPEALAPDGPHELWLLGSVSERAKAGIEAAGWTVKAGLFEAYFASTCDPRVPELAIGDGA